MNDIAYAHLLMEQTSLITRGLNVLKKQGNDCDWVGLIAGCLLTELKKEDINILIERINNVWLLYKEERK